MWSQSLYKLRDYLLSDQQLWGKKMYGMKLKVLASVCVLFLFFSMASAGQGFIDNLGSDENEKIVIIRAETEDDLFFVRSIGVDVIEKYSNQLLIEVNDKEEMQLRDAGLEIKELPQRTKLSLKSHPFDLEEGIDFSEELTIDGYDPGTKGLYLVHMLGPVHPDWRDQLEKRDIEIINYVPNYAYEVRMTPETAERVDDLEFIDWVGIYQPGFKLAENLETGKVMIRLVEEPERRTLKKIGSKIEVLSVTESATYGMEVKGQIEDPSTFSEIARMKDVYHISDHQVPELNGEMETQIIGGGCWIWDPEDDPDTAYRGHGDYGSLANQLGYKGEGIEIAVADTGIGDGTEGDAGHEDFTGRVVGGHSFEEGAPSWADGYGHGTHCTGSAAGDTYNGTGEQYYENYYAGQGSAPETDLFAIRVFDDGGSWVGPEDRFEVLEISKQEADSYVHTNSYGEDAEGAYDMRSEAYDKAVRDANRETDYNEPLNIFAAAGNEGPDSRTINSPASGKNVLAIGATENYYEGGTRGGATEKLEAQERLNGDPEKVSYMSSRGWTTDNRIKPDLVAPGEDVMSTMPDGGYDTKTGTSMATPAAAGAAAVVVEWYEDTYGTRPSPAMVKALMINTAHNLQGEYEGNVPTPREGWGLVNLPDLVYSDSDFLMEDQTSLLQTGEIDEYEVSYEDSSEPLKISLVWTDKEALAGDNWTLKNDLNLEVESPSGELYRGNAFNKTGEGNVSDTGYTFPDTETIIDFDQNEDGRDDVNNVQNVYIDPDELESGTYTVRVIGENVPSDANNDGTSNQDYALVKYNAVPEGDPPSVDVTSPEGGETLEAGMEEDIIWTTEEGDDPIDHVNLWYSTDGGASWDPIASQIEDTGNFTWTVPNEPSTESIIRAQVKDMEGRSGEDESGQFTIEGEAELPDPPSDLKVYHHGSVGTTGDEGFSVWETEFTSPYDDEMPVDVYYPQNGSKAPHPSLVLGHGFTQDRTDFQSWGEYYASRGFVIAIPDMQHADVIGADHEKCAYELLATVDFLKQENNNSDSPISGIVDEEKMGMTGFSLGAKASILAAQYEVEDDEYEEDLKALAPMAVAIDEDPDPIPGLDLIDIPVQLQAGTNDEVAPPEDNSEEVYENLEGSPTQYFLIEGANHYQYGDEDAGGGIGDGEPEISREEQHRIARRYSCSFFNYYLNDEEEYGEYLYGLFAEQDVSEEVLAFNRFKNVNYSDQDEITGFEDNMITWNSSPDDPDPVEYYSIYRSENSTGPWEEPIAEVPADGSENYSYIDEGKGSADDIFWWYVVRAVSQQGEEENTASVQEPGGDPLLLPPDEISVDPEEDTGGITLEWENTDAPEYNIYHSEDRYGDFEPLASVSGSVTAYVHEGALGGEDYYFIKPSDGDIEGEGSDVVFSVEKHFYSEGSLHYISIPMGFKGITEDEELRASDLVADIEGDTENSEYISEVVKWDHVERGPDESYYYDESIGEWTDDFVIEGGVGVGLSVKSEFVWYITGSDIEHEMFFGDERPRHYVSVPYTLADQTGDGKLMASDLVMAIEGGLDTRDHISDVVKWDPSIDGYTERYHYDGLAGEWVDDFEIEPGDGIGFAVESEFTWEIEILSAESTRPFSSDSKSVECVDWGSGGHSFYLRMSGGVHRIERSHLVRVEHKQNFSLSKFLNNQT